RLLAQFNGVSKKWSSRLDYGFILRQFRLQAPFQFLAQFVHFHAGHDDELASQHFARLIVVRQLTAYTAILAILIPAEASVGNRLRAQKLEAAQQGIPLRHLKLLAQDRDLDEFFIRPKRFRHDTVQFPRASVAGRDSMVSGSLAKRFTETLPACL